MPIGSGVSSPAAATGGGRLRTRVKISTVSAACSTPTLRKELRQPIRLTASAKGAVPARFPRLPSATINPDTLPNSFLLNQWLKMVKVPIRTDEVPTPSSTRAAMASPMVPAWEKSTPPSAVSTLQAPITTRLPKRSIIGPSGICAAA